MTRHVASLVAASLLFGAPCVVAQFAEPPTITPTLIERRLSVSVSHETGGLNEDELNTQGGPFVQSITAEESGFFGSTGSGAAQQSTQISSFSIRGDGGGTSIASLGSGADAMISVSSNSTLVVTFSVPVDSPFSLSGSFEAVTPPDFLAFETAGTLTFSGFDSEGALFFHYHNFNGSQPTDEGSFQFVGSVGANTQLHLSITIEATRFGQTGNPHTSLGVSTGSFDFVLDLGDRDGDGLLDSWEEDGIDFPGDGIEIDLPAMGADPDRKDLFVELDVMSGVPIDPAALAMVVAAFADAPAESVDNPDGSQGVTLHLVHDDGDSPPYAALQGTGDDIWSQFDAIKSSHLGSPQDRDHPWSSEILLARERIFRYCLWADRLDWDGAEIGGLAEEVVGGANDFIVAAGRLGDRYHENPTKARAGVLMHELGHTLGLNHGGLDEDNFKPNYLSVMNYAYVAPFNGFSVQGTRLADAWHLDYSRAAMRSLNESQLVEADGLDGPAGRRIIFNSASEGDANPVARTIAWATSSAVNWDNDADPAEVDPYPLDLTRLKASAPPEYNHDLRSFSDWDRLWYHLSGTENFNDKGGRPARSSGPDVDLDVLADFAAVDWFDQTAASPDLIFADGFESGSTAAW